MNEVNGRPIGERGRENNCFITSPSGGRFGKPRGSPDGGRGLVPVLESNATPREVWHVENRGRPIFLSGNPL